MRRTTAALGLLCFLSLAQLSFGQANPLITVDENGHGSLLFPGGPPIPTVGVLAPDPGPGGLAAALSYNLLGPPGLVAGDIFLTEGAPGAQTLSDVIRFNPAGTGNPGYPASLIFYSDIDAVIDGTADTGLPIAFYTNTVTLAEIALGGGQSGAAYTPNAGQPGFVPGFAVSYMFISDTPEPGTIAMMLG